MNEIQEDKWSALKDQYPEVAEALMSHAGFAEYFVDPDLSEEDEFLLDFLKHDFDEGSGDDLFDEIERSRGSELEEASPLRERSFVDERLDYLASQGLLGRVPLEHGGYHYGSLRMCIYSLMERGDSDDILVDEVYWLSNEAGIPVQQLVLTALNMVQASLSLEEN